MKNAFLLCLLLLAGSQPWEKLPAEWTRSDIRRILNNSPWTASFEVDAYGESRMAYVVGGGDIKPPSLTLFMIDVSWISSQIVLSALPKEKEGPDGVCAQVSEKNRERFYLIRVDSSFGGRESPFRVPPGESAKKGKIYLSLSGDRQIPCRDVVAVGAQGYTFILAFPRHAPDGSELIQPGDKKVTVHLTVGGPDIAVPFDLTEMKYRGRLDL